MSSRMLHPVSSLPVPRQVDLQAVENRQGYAGLTHTGHLFSRLSTAWLPLNRLM